MIVQRRLRRMVSDLFSPIFEPQQRPTVSLISKAKDIIEMTLERCRDDADLFFRPGVAVFGHFCLASREVTWSAWWCSFISSVYKASFSVQANQSIIQLFALPVIS